MELSWLPGVSIVLYITTVLMADKMRERGQIVLTSMLVAPFVYIAIHPSFYAILTYIPMECYLASLLLQVDTRVDTVMSIIAIILKFYVYVGYTLLHDHFDAHVRHGITAYLLLDATGTIFQMMFRCSMRTNEDMSKIVTIIGHVRFILMAMAAQVIESIS